MKLATWLVTCTLAFGVRSAYGGQGPKPVVPGDFHALTWVGDPHWSPAGDRIVFVTSISNEQLDGYDKNLWEVRPDGRGLRQLTHHPKADFAPRWSPDGRELLFLSSREGSPRVYRMRSDGGEPECLTPFDLPVLRAEWIPGRHAISFVAPVPETWRTGPRNREEMRIPEDPDLKMGVRVIRDSVYRGGGGYFEGKRPHLFSLDLDTGRIRQLTAGAFDVAGFSWSPDGTSVAVLRNRLGDAEVPVAGTLVLVRPDGGVATTLGDRVSLFDPGIAWRPGGNEIVVSEDVPDGPTATYLVHAVTGEWRRLETGLDLEVFVWRWGPSGRHLHALAGEKGEVHLWSFDPASGKGRRITSGRRQIGFHSQMFTPAALSPSPDGRRFVASETRTDRPEELVLIDTATGKIEPITDLNRAWRSSRLLVPATKFTYRLGDGTEIDAWIMPPAGRRRGTKYPLVMEIHGGPWTMYGEHFMIEFQCLAGAGMGVLYVNFRGSSGYGQASKNFILDNMTAPYEDLVAAVDTAVRRFGWIDPERLAVAGGSYGGYMTAWMIGQTDRFKAAVTMRGLYNYVSWKLSWDLLGFSKYFIKADPWTDPLRHWQLSPLAHATKIKTPTLILHSENDFRCPITEAEQFYSALKLHRVPAEFVRYRDEPHGLSRKGRPDRRVDRLGRIVSWLERWLK